MLSKEEVDNIALLSRIGLQDDEVVRYQRDLSAVFDFFHELDKLPTDNVEPIGHITGRADVSRPDMHVDFNRTGKTALLRNAPYIKDNFFKVRSVF